MERSFIITAKCDNPGTANDDSGDMNKYTELGWEIVGTRLDCIRMLQNGIVSRNDTVVTHADRAFLYSKIFNVVPWDEFKEQPRPEKVFDLAAGCMIQKPNENPMIPISRPTFMGLVDFLEEGPGAVPYKKYRFLSDDYGYIRALDLVDVEPLINNKPFVCMGIRARGHSAHRNSPKDYWVDMIGKISDRWASVFVVGKGSEEFCQKDNVYYVDRLQIFASLLCHNKCEALIGSGTGTMLMAFCCTKAPVCMIDHTGGVLRDGYATNNPINGGRCCNFTGTRRIDYNELIAFEQLIKDIKHER